MRERPFFFVDNDYELFSKHGLHDLKSEEFLKVLMNDYKNNKEYFKFLRIKSHFIGLCNCIEK